MIKFIRISITVLAASFLLSGCFGDIVFIYGSGLLASSVGYIEGTPQASDFIITAMDIRDRQYKVVGELEAYVEKLSDISDGPTIEHLNFVLEKKARPLGADAVVLVNYSFEENAFSRATAKGTAIRFMEENLETN